MLKAFRFRSKDIFSNCFTFNAVSELVLVLRLRAEQVALSSSASERARPMVQFPVIIVETGVSISQCVNNILKQNILSSSIYIKICDSRILICSQYKININQQECFLLEYNVMHSNGSKAAFGGT
jgi:hypothetical protein